MINMFFCRFGRVLLLQTFDVEGELTNYVGGVIHVSTPGLYRDNHCISLTKLCLVCLELVIYQVIS